MNLLQNDSPELKLALEKSESWMITCATLIDKASFTSSCRLRVSISLLHLCIEHQTAIHILIDNNVAGSAFTLLRPQLESYVRGIWYQYCATDDQIDDFLSGKEPPKISSLISDIEKIEGFEIGFLSNIKETAWGRLCDFTHGGTVQVKARNNINEIISSYKPSHIVELLKAAATFSMMAAHGISLSINDTQLSNLIFEKFIESGIT